MAMKRVDKYLQKYISLNPLPKTYLVSQFVSAAEVTAQCDTEGLIQLMSFSVFNSEVFQFEGIEQSSIIHAIRFPAWYKTMVAEPAGLSL
jgi:hypothetical protein